MDSRLIFVEGLPGSGKSSTSQFICNQLRRHGQRGRWYHEEEPRHPVAPSKGLQDADSFAPYSETELGGWRDFVSTRTRWSEITIESRFFQGVIWTLLKVDLSPARTVEYIHAIAAATRTSPTGDWLVTGQRYPRISDVPERLHADQTSDS